MNMVSASHPKKAECHLEISNLELQVLCVEVFLSPKGYGRSDLTNGSHRCSRDYALEWGPTGAQCCSRQSHLVKFLQEQDVQGTTSIDKHSVGFYILDDRANNERIPSQLWHEIRVVAVVKGDGDLGPLKLLGDGR
jgi:hypothetical protein